MSYSQTNSNTRSYTMADVRKVNDKIAGDLEYLLSLYPKLFLIDDLTDWKHDFFHWMNEGYAKNVQVRFFRNGECFSRIQWEVKDGGTISADDNVGKIRLNNLVGATTSIYVTYSDKWLSSSDQEKVSFYKTLKLTWGVAASIQYAPGLIEKMDKQYSSGSFGVQRSVLGG
jgi:hypothetical protein